MTELITGGSASGKSACAEQRAVAWNHPVRYYIATMKPWGEEGERRVARHRRMRKDKGFVTIECYSRLNQLVLPVTGGVVLLECVSNLVANEQFDEGKTEEQVRLEMIDGIRHLQKQAEHIIIVTNEVFSDGCSYSPETERYIRLLGSVNADLSAMADQVTEVVYGIPVTVRAGSGRESRNTYKREGGITEP